jgi:preprotein translocase subunit YajC
MPPGHDPIPGGTTGYGGGISAPPPIQAAPPPADGGGGFNPMVMILLYVAVFAAAYFFMIRPHRKREKAMRELQSGIKTGDNIVTTGGLFGRVSDVGTDCFVIEFGISGRTMRVPVLKTDVLGVREPVLTPPPKETTSESV